MKNKNKIQFKETRLLEIIIPAFFMMLIVALSALALRLTEEKFMQNSITQITKKMLAKEVSGESNGRILGISTTQEKKDYQAELINTAYSSIRIYPGKALTFWVDFKNTGSKTW